jgi:hypothetical protein
LLPTGGDVWIEDHYTSSTTGEKIPYYWHSITEQCYKGDAPTGAAKCIYYEDIKYEPLNIRLLASLRVRPSKDSIRVMPVAHANLEIVRRVLAGPTNTEEQQEETVLMSTIVSDGFDGDSIE